MHVEETVNNEHGSLRRILKSGCLILILIVAGTTGFAKSERVVKRLNVLGSATVSKNNMARSKQAAVKDALNTAVGMVVLEMLTEETAASRFQLINKHILANPDMYIENYRVLTDSVSGGAIRALVQVDVSVDRLNQDLLSSGVVDTDAEVPQTRFMVIVEGTGGHIASFVRLRKTITSLSGVKELSMKEMSADQAIMSVNYQGNTRSLADALLMETFTGFNIDIVEVTPERVRIHLENRQ